MATQRNFSSGNLANQMSLDQAEKLHEYQERYENNPQSIEFAYTLYRELNKHGMYLTVIRLYYKYDMDRASTSNKYTELMKSQFEYAKDHIEQLKVTQGADGGDTYEMSGRSGA